ncbi:S8 family peptidase [Nocardioides sambongensis]|uniref:S8 family peptidase n=1 Tax=Nocardioides sambongensis TaxID=2589074 RepID=UPI00112C4777|nr:S8/S53 family peptidase [Nocardioides sambongensis]
MNAERPSQPSDLIAALLRRLRGLIPFGKGPAAPAGVADPDPTPQPSEEEDLDAAIKRAQVKVLRDAFGDNIATAAEKGLRPPRDDADTRYLYRTGHALVAEPVVERVREYLANDDRYRGDLRVLSKPTEGLVLVGLPTRRSRDDKSESADVLQILNDLERAGVVGSEEVSPDHIVYLTGSKGGMCPATEPEMVSRRTPVPWPPVAPCPEKVAEEKKVRVGVVDSGLWTDAVGSAESPWLEVDDIFADPSDVEIVNPSAIHPYAGHGTFVAGVIACMAPETRVEVEGVLTHGGAIYESEIVQQLHEALTDDDHPQIISISAGTHSRGGMALLSFTMLAATHQLEKRDDVLIVAAAGNDASDEPFWPAAFPWVVSVGSVDQDGGVSDFSNVGRWVDVYARGRDHVNAFPHGSYTCYEPPHVGEVRTFSGVAQWSGTSFSTPIVTGLIAAHMQATGESAQQALAAVMAGATTSTDPRGGTIKTVGPLT